MVIFFELIIKYELILNNEYMHFFRLFIIITNNDGKIIVASYFVMQFSINISNSTYHQFNHY